MSEIHEAEEGKSNGNGASVHDSELQPETISLTVEEPATKDALLQHPAAKQPPSIDGSERTGASFGKRQKNEIVSKNEISEITEEPPPPPTTEESVSKRTASAKVSRNDSARDSARSPAAVKRTPSVRPGGPQPGPADLKLLSAANVPVDKFAPFVEIQWISNLSEGAMGEVHRVKWRGIDCAAKRLKGKHMKDTNSPLYRDMLKEMYVMSKLGYHPHVVQFYGVCSGPQGDPVILLELVVGPSLEDFLNGMKSMLPQWRKQRATLMAWSKGFLKGLSFLHERDPIILHRDLKPGNILLADGLRCIKIADFGVSRLLYKSDRLQRSLTGMTGTRRYMAPEVYACKQGPYSEKADIYSAALVMWEIATGVKPFDGVPAAELQQAAVRKRLRPPLELLDWQEFGGLLTKAWHVNPEKRPGALELIEELEALPGAPDPRAEMSPILGSPSGAGAGVSGRGEVPDNRVGCQCTIL